MGTTGSQDRLALLDATPTLGNRGRGGAVSSADFDQLAAELESKLDSLAAQVIAGVRRKHPDLDWSTERLCGRVAELTRESLRVQLHCFRRSTFPDRCPEVDTAAVSALAPSAGLPMLLDGYRLCQVTLWQAWFELVEDTLEPGAAERRELLSCGSDFFFRYADLLGGFVAEAYQRQVARPGTSAAQRRYQAIIEFLDGDALAASWLDLDLERHHLALIACGEDPAAAPRRLAVELGRPLLCVITPDPEPTCWAWLSASRPLQPAEEHRLACFDPGVARLALGLESFGEAGFRAAHRQALRTHRFASDRGPGLLRYEDVVVEALACENEDDARAFVAHELRGIEDDSATSCRLRETLVAYFESEYNAASASARLGVHQQTVANRLRAAEERLGTTSIGVRRVELEMALRLHERLSHLAS